MPVEAKIVQADCGLEHSVLLDMGGRLFVSGSNEKGQLGLGEIDQANLNFIEPRQVPNFSDCAK